MINDLLIQFCVRHFDAKRYLVGSARRAVFLLAILLCSATTTSAQVYFVGEGVIANQGDVATYNRIIQQYPDDLSYLVPDIVNNWTRGYNYVNWAESPTGEHWDNTNTSTKMDRYEQNGLNANTHYKTTTITLQRGRYTVLTPARASASVTLSLRVNAEEITMAGIGNTGTGITTSGEASFEGGTYANGNNGYGWRYFYIQFEVTAENASVELRVSGSSSGESWMSFTTPRLRKARPEIAATGTEVTHRISYLYDYARQYGNYDLENQGLATDAQSDWWNYGKETQKVNHFEITHYVKLGETVQYALPTVLNADNDHRQFQRWYNYDNETDLTGLKSHLSLNSSDGIVPYYLYNNGMVTGYALDWGNNIADGLNPYALRYFNFTNSDGQPFTVAADVSRYSDMTYENPGAPLAGNLEEPSLTMRYIYYMRDAKEMAANLSSFTKQNDADVNDNNWLESKVFHFPSKPLPYENEKLVGYRGEFIGLRHVFSDYWVFDGNGTSDANLVSAVNDNNGGKIKVVIYDPHNTGIRLGGYNPNINLRNSEAWGDNMPQVGDYIRVNFTHATDAINGPIYKHWYDDNGTIPDWQSFENNKTPPTYVGTHEEWVNQNGWNLVTYNYGYVEAPIASEADVQELIEHGMRFQGLNFRMNSVELVRNGTVIQTIMRSSQQFNGWGVIVTLPGVVTNAEGNDGDYEGYFFYDKMYPYWPGKTSYGDSRFVSFRYPSDGNGGVKEVENTGENNKAYLRVYLQTDPNNDNTKYQLAQFTIIFDEDSETLPWKSVNGSAAVQGTARDPNNLRERAGKPIAKITFDYPAGDTYHYPSEGITRHDNGEQQPGGTIANSSPIPLTFDGTNYSFDGDGANWAAYAMVSQKSTRWGMQQLCMPANDAQHGYNIAPDARFQSAFLYIDASEQPGDICSAPFEGDFCAGDHLMVSGWITGCNVAGGNDSRCPGGITLTLKGEHTVNGEKVTETLYRFCPGQVYELDDGTVPGEPGSIPGPYQDRYNVVWQQFYFDFVVEEKYDRHWLEVNNNCVSSTGGDFMLDNIEVYTLVPEVIADINTPICVDKDGHVDMRLLKLMVNFNKEMATANVNGGTGDLGFVFLKKDVFLSTFKENLRNLNNNQLNRIVDVNELVNMFGLDEFSWDKISLDDLAYAIEEGLFSGIQGDNPHQSYKNAFNAALLGDHQVWTAERPSSNLGAGVMYFQWNTDFGLMPKYSFEKAVNKTAPTYGYTDEDGIKWIVMNGNYPELPWEPNVDYYIVPSNETIHNFNQAPGAFNICSPCSKASVFRLDPPYEILGLESSDATNEVEVCEGTIPTVSIDLIGYDLEGKPVPMQELNYDWWLGDPQGTPALVATLSNFIAQNKNGLKLNQSLSAFRSYYPEITNLDGVYPHEASNGKPALTQAMIDYLQEEVDLGRLVLHQSSVSVSALKTAENDPYVYLVACPIHDGNFDAALNKNGEHEFVSYFCDEPQGLRIKIGNKAPSLKTGFVPNENGFESYNYEGAGNAVLSIRLAKKEQFMTVQHGTTDEIPVQPAASNAETTHYLWLPIRDAEVQSEGSTTVIQKAEDENIYLASTNDPIWDKAISRSMKRGVLPIVGKIVELNAVDKAKSGQSENGNNRLCVYFTEDFDVREGYSYTLSLPFQENPVANVCTGNILINLKIVPDYEVWTGAAGNTDWNNDENWRRADGNTSNQTDPNSDELYRANGASSNESSPLNVYMTNHDNYRSSRDRVFRKGFAPLYCTHVLIKSDEWGDAPQLYDALDGQENLTYSPFPNLRDKDGWDGTFDDENTGATATKATSTPILRFDMQARLYDIWSETYGVESNKGRSGDLIAEMYQINSCDEIAFQPSTELLNAHLLNYNNAWVEYKLNNKRWYLLGSPLQGTISGEWYAPTGKAQQETTYYDNVTFGAGYDRYSPAIYQRSWDKAKAVLYEVGAEYSTSDNPNDLADDGSANQGTWNGNSWDQNTADAYLGRLGYKPMGNKKANVAIKGIWSNTYNDATVDYTKGGFSVMVMNHLKDNDQSEGESIIRLPKEDTMYDYYGFDRDGEDNPASYEDIGTNTQLSDVQTALGRALNRGRLKTDLLLPTQDGVQKQEKEASRYGDKRSITRIPIFPANLIAMNAINDGVFSFTEDVSAGASNLGYYLVENPFQCGLDMKKFFAANTNLNKKYWLLTVAEESQSPRQQLVQQAPNGEWIISDGNSDFAATDAKVAPGQGFFVQGTMTPGEGPTPTIPITFTADMQVQTRYGEADEGKNYDIVVGTKQKMIEIPALDEDGQPLLDENNQPIMVEVPEVNDNGEYVLEDIIETVTIYKYKQKKGDGYEFPLRTRGEDSSLFTLHSSLPSGLVITAKRDNSESSALVMQRESASNDFLPEEDTEVFINSDLVNAPTVYTLCGRLATAINSIHDFRCLPVGVESTSDAPCTLTFEGVEMLGDSIAFYDAVEKVLTPLKSGMTFSVSGQTQNRYYLVRSLIQEEAAAETHLQIFTEGLKAKVIASTAEPIIAVRCFDLSGQLLYSASPQSPEHSFTLPHAGVYIIDAQTENDRKTKKVIVK